jgi:hypothetical protein
MMYPHVIRLREPWQRLAIPGGVRHQRGFNLPTGLDDREEVWLVVEEVSHPATVFCNGQAVGHVAPGEAGEFSIKELLSPRNEARIEMQTGDQERSAATVDGVCLEIRLGAAPITPAAKSKNR